MRQVRITYDTLSGGDLHGWSARLEAPETAEDQLSLFLTIGDRHVGLIPRTLHRPDVDADVKYGEVHKGFEFRATPLLAFSALNGGPAVLPVGLTASDPGNLPVPIPTRFLDAALASIGSPISAEPVGRLDDAWFASDVDLRLRYETEAAPDGPSDFVLAGFQMTFEPKVELCVLPDRELGAGLSLVTLPLQNPLLPVLLVLKDQAGRIHSVNLLPFPSLCRGGPHYPELRARGAGADDGQGLWHTSDHLLRELLGRPNAPDRRIGTLSVDLAGATGNELIFNTGVLEWLSGIFGLSVGPARAGTRSAPDPEMAAYFAGLFQDRNNERHGQKGSDELILPVDALPTIAALVRRDPVSASPGQTSCPVLIHRHGLKEEAWTVGVPHFADWFLDLQPAGVLPFPILNSADAGSASPTLTPEEPIAIRRLEVSAQAESDRLFRVDFPIQAAPLGGAPLAEGMGPPSVSVCLALDGPSQNWPLLLESLAQQEGAESIELILAVRRADLTTLLSPLVPTLDRLFAGQHRSLVADDHTSGAALLNAAAAEASGSFLLFVAEDVVLQDPRTLVILRSLAAGRSVASASCQIIRPIQNGMEVSFAGYFLTGFSLTASPAVTYEAASTDSLPLSTFPVAANSCSLLMADRITFGHIGGFDPRMFSGVCDIDFGMRVIDAGFINLNTVGASAYATQIKPRGRYDVDLSRRLPHLDLNRLRSLTTVVRRVL